MSDMHDPYSPQEADYLAEPPRWPKVVGIISICWASLGMLCGVCGVLSPQMMRLMPKEALEKMGSMPPAMLPTQMQTTAAGVGMAWAVLLLVAGIVCVMRRPAARPLHLVYALGAIGLTFWSMSMSLDQMAAMNEWVKQNPTSEWAKMHNPMFGLVALAAGVVLGLGWPGFCLLWFGFVKRRREDFTGGAPAPAA